MVTPLAFGALALAAILGTFIMWTLNEPAVRATVSFVDRIRYVVGIIFLGIAARHLLLSGNPLYIGLAMAAVAFLTGYALMERPWENTI